MTSFRFFLQRIEVASHSWPGRWFTRFEDFLFGDMHVFITSCDYVGVVHGVVLNLSHGLWSKLGRFGQEN